MCQSTGNAVATLRLLTIAVAIVVGGCGAPQETSPQGQGAELPHSGAPAIANPLDLGEFGSAPCKILSPEELASIKIKVTNRSANMDRPGPMCTYERDDALLWGLSVTFLTSESEGLSRSYEGEKVDPAAYFEEVPSVSGYPGVLTGLIDDRAEGNCGLLIGIRDDLVVQVLLTDDSGAHPCKRATEVGRLVVDRLKAAN